jgi:hypothetical protein
MCYNPRDIIAYLKNKLQNWKIIKWKWNKF